MKEIDLDKISTKPPELLTKSVVKKETKQLKKEIDELQNLLYAESQHALLVVLQGMDASGKDGLVRHVFSIVNPQGVNVKSFKEPTEIEKSHDFLWRIHKETPATGMIKIFNRSHYEDILVTRVFKMIDEDEVQRRFRHINDFERLLTENGTIVLKFYLHISKEEQAKRLKERVTNPMKNWKYSKADGEMAKHWNAFRDCYHDIFRKCSPEIPWDVIPSDQNWYKEYLVARKIVATLRSLKMKYPRLED